MSTSGLKRSIILIGFMGCGKTTIGRVLARRARMNLVDTDALVVREAGMSIPEIFAQQGENGFRDIESRVLRGLADLPPVVLSTGGGIVLRQENREMLRSLGSVIWLCAEESEILDRVLRNSSRPLVQTEDPAGTVHRLLAERSPLYEQTAHAVLKTSGLEVGLAAHRALDLAAAIERDGGV